MSNQMNPWLASIYGTDQADDLEKTAQAHLLNKLAAENNLDLSQYTPEEIEQLVQELAASGYDVGALMQPNVQQQQQPQQPVQPMQQMQPGMQQQPGRPFAPAQGQQPQMPQGMNPQMMQGGAQQQEAMQKEAQAKFEEADLLGRVMAHAYTDELEKIGAARMLASGNRAEHAARSAGRAVRDAAHKVGGHIAGHAKGVGLLARKHKGAIGAAAAGAAAGEVHGRMSKKASAFEKLAEEHAADILSATGYDPSTGQDVYGQQMLQNSMGQQQQPQQPQQMQPQQAQQPQQFAGVQQQPVEPQQDQFVEALDQRALELLAENGYDVNEILARIQLAQNQPPAQA